ncbi:MAG: flagellar cap protein FliD N-terminal domain-containing protein, partial [Planctomycetota bacterium]
MGRIQTNIGLITGIPIGDTVEKLMQLAARPRDLVIQRNDAVKQEQVALTGLSALLVSVQYMATNLGKENLYDQRIARSSNESVLSATVTGDPPKGTYQFTPLRLVQSHQLLSSGFKTDTAALGGGTLAFRFGDHVERSAELDALRGGQGVARGAIRIVDRSGASAEIDLSIVQTVDDVLEAVNSNTVINVTATAQGDRIRLTDQTGQTVSNLKVLEVGGGGTAASLGLGGIDVAQDTADGQDIFWLTDDLELDLLNDGSGVFADRVLDDIGYELRDGTSGTIDLSPIIPGGSQVDEETTLGELLEAINAAAPDKLKAEIAPVGDRLILTDLTSGGGNFAVESLGESTLLDDLGLDGGSVG